MKPVSAQRGFGLILILVVIGLSIAGGVGIYYFTRASKNTPTASASPTAQATDLNVQITDLKKQLAEMQAEKASKEDLSRLTDQLQALESPIPSPTEASTVTVYSSKTPVYIPIGSSTDSVTATDWKSFDSLTFSADPADYAGNTGMTLEVNIRSNAGGTAYARIINVTDNSMVDNTEVSTTSTTFAFLTSGQFKLSGGKKTYKIQGKNPTGDPIFIQNARIKVTF
ncbi:hypothetical protein A2631_01320 [Candidatus Daviesbacteria bacterium RIFCSPHIGHO2_01_FULL_44_29]|uniref:Uncharacterized protein n=1 Tax=Candidatus Daviesbacteria bacterium RIFCSPHIGHO2_02_FULL_43_12 TaxID=1797776 RepID=A0A1F5KKV8_9BACT|nr:MAG: hypothetical protein A2631_01320 [Candidatus Daviesbacteria bacterium RIFCSPHIGHO2_01_FULL_44_29]OGE39674.1 MAG: hypothetical protein A3E86_00020 [Candidatus Daviesbacteria bacterium RIFCSPHIGHO2_12_FULL_47_45]OGE41532.1 MAG: hypothetical protein A3D25_00740 [Candidatus Daviesbacteria bacterium RIFCSPHIGHO2_02_FULL_43_12]OGE69814.1 MAG: hypothetical protein A3B55_05385 [Candidatus Daviesbacteria bacterium RIFCSPLOWO2_01_FULL_43_15]